MLFHAELSWFSGGFVGVDVFFVLSGFLITGLLLDERDRSGRISFGDFYARRARRLLPASILVFVATILAAVAMMSPLDLLDLGSQARWTALFGSNIWFARHATHYLQPDVISPFQQYWSLAVEEQFYLIWPPVILLLALGARSRRALLKRVGIGLGVICVASFTSVVWLTAVRQPSAFFLLPPRAWELGAGGLLAIALRLGLRVRPRMRKTCWCFWVRRPWCFRRSGTGRRPSFPGVGSASTGPGHRRAEARRNSRNWRGPRSWRGQRLGELNQAGDHTSVGDKTTAAHRQVLLLAVPVALAGSGPARRCCWPKADIS